MREDARQADSGSFECLAGCNETRNFRFSGNARKRESYPYRPPLLRGALVAPLCLTSKSHSTIVCRPSLLMALSQGFVVETRDRPRSLDRGPETGSSGGDGLNFDIVRRKIVRINSRAILKLVSKKHNLIAHENVWMRNTVSDSSKEYSFIRANAHSFVPSILKKSKSNSEASPCHQTDDGRFK